MKYLKILAVLASAITVIFLVSCTKPQVIISSVKPPVAAFNLEQNQVRTSQLTQFYDHSTGEVTSWSWDFGDNYTSQEQNPSHSYARPGNYTITLIASNKGGSNSMNLPVTVLQPPKAFIDNSSDVFNTGQEIQFLEMSEGTIDSYLWDFGDGITSILRRPTHSYSQKGDYYVSLTVSNPIDRDTYGLWVTIVRPPVAMFSVPKTKLLIGEMVKFSDESMGDIRKRFWDFGDNTTSNMWRPEHSYKSAGAYTVSLKVSNDAGSDIAIKEDYIKVSPLAIKTIYTSNVTEKGEYIPKENSKFLPNENVWVVYEITGFDQRKTEKGYETWVKVNSVKIGSFKESYEQKDVFEVHEISPEPSDCVRFWVYAGKYEPLDILYLGFVNVTFEDAIGGFSVNDNRAFIVQK
jgi:PKD repeat protein